MSTSRVPNTLQIQGMLIDHEDLSGFLSQLARAVVSDLAQHVGISMKSVGGSMTVAISDASVIGLDEQQNATGEGPCIEAMDTGVTVSVSDMGAETRWGPYPAAAAAAGVRSVVSFPLSDKDRRPLGALNMYSMTGASPYDLQARARLFAARANHTLELAARVAERDYTITHLRQAMESRSVIATAVGIVMGRQGCDATAALALLIHASNTRRQKLRDLAASMVASKGQTLAPSLS